MKFTVQVAPEDCTGCGACVQTCPGIEKGPDKQPTGRKAINMEMQEPIRERERKNYAFFLSIPNTNPALFKANTVKGSQLIQPLFEYSGACAGCGETAYVKLLTQLFGDRAYIGNATGCSSIYGGNLPTTPYTTRKDGRGPTWCNSLFEDNAEFAHGHETDGRSVPPDRAGPSGQGGAERLRGGEARGRDPGGDTGRRSGASRDRDAARPRRAVEGAVPQAGQLCRLQAVAHRGRLPGAQERLGGRRRRLGLRHRLRRPGSRPGHRQERQHAGAGHGGLLQYRRPDVEVDAPGGRGEVRGGRQADSRRRTSACWR